MGLPRKPIVCTDADTQRFWAKVDKTPGQGPRGTCWGWKASKTKKGHGRFGLTGVGWVLAYRYSYVLRHGPIPDDQELHHECENPPCVNPDCLLPATHRDHNVLLTPHSNAAKNAAKTHCINGHEFTPENTYVWAKEPGQRACKTCRKERVQLLQSERRRERQEQGVFGKRNHPQFECPRCGRMIRGRANLNIHLRRPTCLPAPGPARPKLPPKPKPAPKVARTHCKNGHAIIPENRKPRRTGGGTDCLLCLREYGKRHYYENREKRIALVVECRRKRNRARGEKGKEE